MDSDIQCTEEDLSTSFSFPLRVFLQMGRHCPHLMWTCSSLLNSGGRSGLCSAAALFPVSAASGLLSPGGSDVNQPLEGYVATIKPAGLALNLQ